MNEKVLYYIWLSRCLPVGSSLAKRLLSDLGDAKKIYDLNQDEYLALGLGKGEIKRLCDKSLEDSEKVLTFCKKNNVGILTFEDPYYPERLKVIEDPPALFYFKGRLKLLDDYPCITMVGTRSCSERGFRHAYEVGFDAASCGAVIVNGLALGIDGACLEGALDAGGYAVGILGCGIDRIYPYGNKRLFEKLEASGLLLSEFQPFTEPLGANFPVRNRVLSGISLATVCFEAPLGSGALITAKHALQQGKRIYAVPGKPYDKTYEGPLDLIKNGANVFTEASDVLTEYSMSFPHRINLNKSRKANADTLDKLVAQYFKKDINPDEPVNRRFGKRLTEKKKQENEKKEFIPVNIPKEVKEPKETNTTANQSESNNAPQGFDPSSLSEPERKIYELLKIKGALTADEITNENLGLEDLLFSLTILEIYGVIEAAPGGKYRLCSHTN